MLLQLVGVSSSPEPHVAAGTILGWCPSERQSLMRRRMATPQLALQADSADHSPQAAGRGESPTAVAATASRTCEMADIVTGHCRLVMESGI